MELRSWKATRRGRIGLVKNKLCFGTVEIVDVKLGCRKAGCHVIT